jgi:queuine/archaeosine tRNA-ribosyltransferase
VQAGEALAGTLNTIHNLAFYLGIMERVRTELAAAATPDLPGAEPLRAEGERGARAGS